MEKAETETQAPGRERTARRDGGESETETGGEGWGRVWEHPDGRGEGRTDRRKLRSLGLEPGTLWLCGATQGSCHGQQWELGGLGAQEPLLAFHTTGRSLQWPGACVTCPLRRAQPARGPLSLSSLLPCPFPLQRLLLPRCIVGARSVVHLPFDLRQGLVGRKRSAGFIVGSLCGGAQQFNVPLAFSAWEAGGGVGTPRLTGGRISVWRVGVCARL